MLLVKRPGDPRAGETIHRTRGKLEGGVIRFTMQTEGGSSEHVPVSFTAVKVKASKPEAGNLNGAADG